MQTCALTRWRSGVRVPTSLPFLLDLPRFAVFFQTMTFQEFFGHVVDFGAGMNIDLHRPPVQPAFKAEFFLAMGSQYCHSCVARQQLGEIG
jgi:hypothetical protein